MSIILEVGLEVGEREVLEESLLFVFSSKSGGWSGSLAFCGFKVEEQEVAMRKG